MGTGAARPSYTQPPGFGPDFGLDRPRLDVAGARRPGKHRLWHLPAPYLGGWNRERRASGAISDKPAAVEGHRTDEGEADDRERAGGIGDAGGRDVTQLKGVDQRGSIASNWRV